MRLPNLSTNTSSVADLEFLNLGANSSDLACRIEDRPGRKSRAADEGKKSGNSKRKNVMSE